MWNLYIYNACIYIHSIVLYMYSVISQLEIHIHIYLAFLLPEFKVKQMVKTTLKERLPDWVLEDIQEC